MYLKKGLGEQFKRDWFHLRCCGANNMLSNDELTKFMFNF